MENTLDNVDINIFESYGWVTTNEPIIIRYNDIIVNKPTDEDTEHPFTQVKNMEDVNRVFDDLGLTIGEYYLRKLHTLNPNLWVRILTIINLYTPIVSDIIKNYEWYLLFAILYNRYETELVSKDEARNIINYLSRLFAYYRRDSDYVFVFDDFITEKYSNVRTPLQKVQNTIKSLIYNIENDGNDDYYLLSSERNPEDYRDIFIKLNDIITIAVNPSIYNSPDIQAFNVGKNQYDIKKLLDYLVERYGLVNYDYNDVSIAINIYSSQFYKKADKNIIDNILYLINNRLISYYEDNILNQQYITSIGTNKIRSISEKVRTSMIPMRNTRFINIPEFEELEEDIFRKDIIQSYVNQFNEKSYFARTEKDVRKLRDQIIRYSKISSKENNFTPLNASEVSSLRDEINSEIYTR